MQQQALGHVVEGVRRMEEIFSIHALLSSSPGLIMQPTQPHPLTSTPMMALDFGFESATYTKDMLARRCPVERVQALLRLQNRARYQRDRSTLGRLE